jgi:hypothetical protein
MGSRFSPNIDMITYLFPRQWNNTVYINSYTHLCCRNFEGVITVEALAGNCCHQTRLFCWNKVLKTQSSHATKLQCRGFCHCRIRPHHVDGDMQSVLEYTYSSTKLHLPDCLQGSLTWHSDCSYYFIQFESSQGSWDSLSLLNSKFAHIILRENDSEIPADNAWSIRRVFIVYEWPVPIQSVSVHFFL